MVACYSKHLTKRNSCILLGLSATLPSLWCILKIYNKYRKRTTSPKSVITDNRLVKTTSHIEFQTFRQLLQIVKIVIPGWTSVEVRYILLVAGSLVVRSFCDLWMVHHISSVDSTVLSVEKDKFLNCMLKFLAIIPFLAATNSMLKYAIGELKIGMRRNLSSHLYKDYLANITYYRLSNLDNRIKNVDHLLTADVEKFCNSFAESYTNISKPFLDIGIYTYKMSGNLSLMSIVMILGYLVISGSIITAMRKPLTHLTINEQKLEGEYRHVNSRLITYSEEIAFYYGNSKEKITLLQSFAKLTNHSRKFLRFSVILKCFENIITKYGSWVAGWSIFAVALYRDKIFFKLNQKDRFVFYYTYSHLLYKLAQSIGGLVYSGRELSQLAGYTRRISELQKVLTEMKTSITEKSITESSIPGKLIIKDNFIIFNKVPVITPNGNILIKELSFEIPSGKNVLVCGPNGSGKSSIFRILGELWPLASGELTKPESKKLFYIPQKPYMTLGTLKDQIIYPQSNHEAEMRGCTDEHLKRYLKLVQLEYLLEREHGLNAIADWIDILSGGEKQRIAMARLFYHAPQFAILDECTSAVSVDVESIMYSYCRNEGITLLTVSHRKSLWKHHDFVLYLDGRGNYTFEPIVEEMEQFGS